MITLQRRHVIIFLQMLFLVLLVFSRSDQETELHQSVADSSAVHLAQDCGDMLIECADMDADTVGADHVSNPDYSIYSNTSLLALTPESGSWPLAAQTHSLPIVYLPLFSPPKIRA